MMSIRACPREGGGDGRGLRATDGWSQADARMPHFRDPDRGPGGTAVVADGEPGHACRDGSDRRVLDTGVEDPRPAPGPALSEGDFELIVANAAHIKQVPGRKTDMNDAMWIADLLACGLIKASFVPPEEIQELRSLMRTRKQFVREQTRQVQRIEKTLEDQHQPRI